MHTEYELSYLSSAKAFRRVDDWKLGRTASDDLSMVRIS